MMRKTLIVSTNKKCLMKKNANFILIQIICHNILKLKCNIIIIINEDNYFRKIAEFF